MGITVQLNIDGVGVGVAEVEGSSTGLALALLAPRIETVRSSGF